MHLVALSGICLGISLYEGRIRSDFAGRRLAAFAAASSWMSAMAVCLSLWQRTIILETMVADLKQSSTVQQSDPPRRTYALETHYGKAE